MDKNITWIKLYRNLKNWHWYKNINTKVLYIHLLLECNYMDYKFENIKSDTDMRDSISKGGKK